MESHLRCLFFALNSRSLYNITQPWDNTGVVRLCLAQRSYRTRTDLYRWGGCHHNQKTKVYILGKG